MEINEKLGINKATIKSFTNSNINNNIINSKLGNNNKDIVYCDEIRTNYIDNINNYNPDSSSVKDSVTSKDFINIKSNKLLLNNAFDRINNQIKSRFKDINNDGKGKTGNKQDNISSNTNINEYVPTKFKSEVFNKEIKPFINYNNDVVVSSNNKNNFLKKDSLTSKIDIKNYEYSHIAEIANNLYGKYEENNKNSKNNEKKLEKKKSVMSSKSINTNNNNCNNNDIDRNTNKKTLVNNMIPLNKSSKSTINSKCVSSVVITNNNIDDNEFIKDNKKDNKDDISTYNKDFNFSHSKIKLNLNNNINKYNDENYDIVSKNINDNKSAFNKLLQYNKENKDNKDTNNKSNIDRNSNCNNNDNDNLTSMLYIKKKCQRNSLSPIKNLNTYGNNNQDKYKTIVSNKDRINKSHSINKENKLILENQENKENMKNKENEQDNISNRSNNTSFKNDEIIDNDNDVRIDNDYKNDKFDTSEIRVESYSINNIRPNLDSNEINNNINPFDSKLKKEIRSTKKSHIKSKSLINNYKDANINYEFIQTSINRCSSPSKSQNQAEQIKYKLKHNRRSFILPHNIKTMISNKSHSQNKSSASVSNNIANNNSSLNHNYFNNSSVLAQNYKQPKNTKTTLKLEDDEKSRMSKRSKLSKRSKNSNKSILTATKACRICYEPESEDLKLLQPCKCEGSMKYIHEECLKHWLDSNKKGLFCEICKAKFHIKFIMETVFSQKLYCKCIKKVLKATFSSLVVVSIMFIIIYFLVVNAFKLEESPSKLFFVILMSICVCLVIGSSVCFFIRYKKKCYETKFKDWRIFDISECK